MELRSATSAILHSLSWPLFVAQAFSVNTRHMVREKGYFIVDAGFDEVSVLLEAVLGSHEVGHELRS